MAVGEIKLGHSSRRTRQVQRGEGSLFRGLRKPNFFVRHKQAEIVKRSRQEDSASEKFVVLKWWRGGQEALRLAV